MSPDDLTLDAKIVRDVATHASDKAVTAFLDGLALIDPLETGASGQRASFIAIFVMSIVGSAAGALAAELRIDEDKLDSMDLVPMLIRLARAARDHKEKTS